MYSYNNHVISLPESVSPPPPPPPPSLTGDCCVFKFPRRHVDGAINIDVDCLRGCLHGKTRTGASFIPGWLCDFVSRFHDDWVFFIIPRPTCWSWRCHLGLTKITHALPVPVYLQTDFTPKRLVVSRLHDTVAKSRTGEKFSPRYENRGDSRWHDILWWYHVNKCRAMRGNRSELAPGAKVAPVSCKHPLTLASDEKTIFQ